MASGRLTMNKWKDERFNSIEEALQLLDIVWDAVEENNPQYIDIFDQVMSVYSRTEIYPRGSLLYDSGEWKAASDSFWSRFSKMKGRRLTIYHMIYEAMIAAYNGEYKAAYHYRIVAHRELKHRFNFQTRKRLADGKGQHQD